MITLDRWLSVISFILSFLALSCFYSRYLSQTNQIQNDIESRKNDICLLDPKPIERLLFVKDKFNRFLPWIVSLGFLLATNIDISIELLIICSGVYAGLATRYAISVFKVKSSVRFFESLANNNMVTFVNTYHV